MSRSESTAMMPRRPAPSRLRPALLAGTIALGLAAGALGGCNPTVDNHGHRVDKDAVAQIQPGQTTRQEVLRRLGSPSSIAPLEGNVWYYVGLRSQYYAFFKPKVTDQDVLAIRFNANGVVADVRQLSLKDAQQVAHVERTTPTRGGEPGLIRSLYDTLLRGPVTRADPKDRPRGPDF
jgi:outer membrane protein assembly factor BamE (lipoprotein component of BamABCDE complex)